MLKRSKTDDEIDVENAGTSGGSLAVVNEDADACELVARLLERAGLAADRITDAGGVLKALSRGRFAAVVVDSTGPSGISAAFRVLDAIRGSAPGLRDTAVVILSAADTNRLFAFQSGVDGYVVRPFHADELIAEVRAVLGRSIDERMDYRRSQLMGGATTG